MSGINYCTPVSSKSLSIQITKQQYIQIFPTRPLRHLAIPTVIILCAKFFYISASECNSATEDDWFLFAQLENFNGGVSICTDFKPTDFESSSSENCRQLWDGYIYKKKKNIGKIISRKSIFFYMWFGWACEKSLKSVPAVKCLHLY